MNGMGDFFTYPPGTNPQEFYANSIPKSPIPIPPHQQGPFDQVPQPLKITEGTMAWEMSTAPFDVDQQKPLLAPSAAPAKIAEVHAMGRAASEAKALEAAQAAKVAADNAVRAARVGAPKVANTNAATAEAAANVAAASAQTPQGQKLAAAAQGHATKAKAAARIAANGGSNGMSDFLELSGMHGMGAGMNWIQSNKWWLLGAAALAFGLYKTKGKYWGK